MVGTPATVTQNTDAIVDIYNCVVKTEVRAEPNQRPSTPVTANDLALIEKMLNAKNGEKARRLWKGDWESGYRSPSEADCALCVMLAYYTQGDGARIARFFDKAS